MIWYMGMILTPRIMAAILVTSLMGLAAFIWGCKSPSTNKGDEPQ